LATLKVGTRGSFLRDSGIFRYIYQSFKCTLTFPGRIITERALLRGFRDEDALEVLEFYSNNKAHLKDVLDEQTYKMSSIDDALSFIKQKKMGWKFNNLLTYGIWLIDEKKFVGEFILFNINHKLRKVEAGAFIAKEYQGRGIITESLKKIARISFMDVNVSVIECTCKQYNFAAHRVIEKCGFIRIQQERKIRFVMDSVQFLAFYQPKLNCARLRGR
jgi:RimJ/RimL family protein N-acetyltransferase